MLGRLLGTGCVRTFNILHWPAVVYSTQVVVPSLGESITDGSIAAVLKAAGDPVKENETIAQIETDKVTIDIKAPCDGTVLGIVVQEQETVVPGQLVATLDDAPAKANLKGATLSQPASQTAPAAAPAPAAAAAAPAPAPTGHRIPGIRFPPRVTADGQRISMLPAAQANAILQEWKAGGGPAATAAAAGTPPAPAAAAAAPKRADAAGALFTSRPAPAAAAAAAAGPSKFATSVIRLDDMPTRRQLTDQEMELIELGGAL